MVEKHRYCGNSVLILWNCDGDSVMLDQMLVLMVEQLCGMSGSFLI